MSKNDNNPGIPNEFKGYIFFKFGSYAVRNDKNKKLITFGRFSSLDVACAATGLLIKYDWNILEVANNPMYGYLDEFWVFNVINNNLIFDRKFSSFEKAVEYMEISPKCNNYHNNILQKKKRKPKYSNIPKIQVQSVSDIENIYERNGLFVVRYKPQGKIYGYFNSIDEAIVAKSLLIENNWNFSTSIEMKFYNSLYWIFKIKENVLYFIDKFESYEDALDCLDSHKLDDGGDEGLNFGNSIKKIDIKYVDDIKEERRKLDERIDSVINSINESKSKNKKKNKPKKATNKKKRSKVHRPVNNYRIPRNKHSFSEEDIEIKELENFDKDNFQIDVNSLKSEYNIVRFQDNTLKDYYSILFLNNGEVEFSGNFNELKEFEYILKFLNVYGWNLDKIKKLSLIHYINNYFYIITSFNGNLVISGLFDSFGEAEENIKFLYDYYSCEVNLNNIKKHGDYYKYIEKHKGKIFEISYQKSLESLKAIIDIFDNYDWNPLEFEDNYIFYYHGLYWDIDYFNHYIKLSGRFYSKENAIKHKIR